jgi:hypothetical protein
MYTIQAKKKLGSNAELEWAIPGLSEEKAIKVAKSEVINNPDLNIFIVFSSGYLNSDGHSPVGKAW